MESSVQSSSLETRRRAGRRLAAQRPFVVRKQANRRAARVRIAGRTNVALTPAQRSFDPLQRGKRSRAVVMAIFGSLAVHVAAVGLGSGLRFLDRPDPNRDEVKIEMRQKPPEPPPPEKKPEQPAPIEKPTAPPPPKKLKAEPPPPVDAPKPVRVIGLSMESTTEGGEGPSFAVGNTRMGDTADKAVAPKDVTAEPPGPVLPGPSGPAKSNRSASRIPVAGVKYELPKRRNPREPPYPVTLKSQAIEGDVPVLVNIDATGKVTSVKILKPSLYPEFDAAARAAALAEEFEPASRDGVPIPYALSFTYRFRLEDE